MSMYTGDTRVGGAAATVRIVVAAPSGRLRTHVNGALRGAAPQPISIVGDARDGRTAIMLCEQYRPHVLVLDPGLSGVDGAEVTGHLMTRSPTPILVVASGTDDDRAAAQACISAGAVDVFARPIPDGGDTLLEWNRALRAAITVVSRIRVVTQHSRRDGSLIMPPVPRGMGSVMSGAVSSGGSERGPVNPGVPKSPIGWLAGGHSPRGVIAIGASTGGPAAITAVLSGMPKQLAVPVLFVQHVNQTFHPSLTRWLRDTTGLRVRSAEHSELLSAATGFVLTAPPGKHLEVRGGLLMLTDRPLRHSCRPSIDVLFESIARDCGVHAVACLLTGMGRDGAAGLLAIRQAGGATIAQDEATSVVYGMPAEAARLGAAQQILPIDQIGPALTGLASDLRNAGAQS